MSPSRGAVADRFADAFDTSDVDRVLACFSPDARYRDLCHGLAVGHRQIRALFELMFADGDRHERTMTRVVTANASTARPRCSERLAAA